MEAVINAQRSQLAREQLRQQLIDSHAAMLRVLNGLSDADLTIPVNHVRLGPMTLGVFLQSAFVAHDQAHLEQARSFLQKDSK